MRLSTADVLTLSDPEAFDPQINLRFSSPNLRPIIRESGAFTENDCDAAPHADEGGSQSTQTLVFDGSDK